MQELKQGHLQDFKLPMDLLVLGDLQIMCAQRVRPHGSQGVGLFTNLLNIDI